MTNSKLEHFGKTVYNTTFLHACYMHAKISNTTSVGKNLKFNQVRGRVALLPSPFFSHYALLFKLTSFIKALLGFTNKAQGWFPLSL